MKFYDKAKCPAPGCDKDAKGRSKFYTCGSRKCMQKIQAEALNVSEKDGHDPATGMTVRYNGETVKVKHSVEIKGKVGYKLASGVTVRHSDVEIVS